MQNSSKPQHYAVVAYVRNSLGHFVEELRRELYPEHGHLPAHVTLLPPRPLCGTEEEAIAKLREHLSGIEEFQIHMNGVETFIPATPTVFLRVERFAHRLRELHEELNVGPLQCKEQWPYMPHLTIVKMPDFPAAEHAVETARKRWSQYQGERGAVVNELTFVREAKDEHWTDLARVTLSRRK